MARVIDSGIYKIAFGLNWAPMDTSVGEKKAIASLLKEHDGKYFVQLTNNNTQLLGTLSDTLVSKPPKAGHLVSAAALFAMHPKIKDLASKNALLILPLDVNKKFYALIALINGLPYVDTHIAMEKLDGRIASIHDETGLTFKIFGDYFGSYAIDSAFSLDDLLNAPISDAALSTQSNLMPLIIILCVALLALAAVLGYKWWQKRQEQLRIEQEAAQLVDPVILYEEALNSQLLKVGPNLQTAIRQGLIGNLLERKPIIGGWNLDSVKCELGACVEKWKRSFGTFASFRDSNTLGQTIYNQGTPNELLNHLNYDLAPDKFSPMDLPTMDFFVMDFGSKVQLWQNLNILVGVEPSKAFPDFASIPSAKARGGVINADVIPIDKQVQKGNIKITGPAGLLLETLANLPTNIVYKRIEMLPKSLSFVLEGQYLVKASKPVDPTVLLKINTLSNSSILEKIDTNTLGAGLPAASAVIPNSNPASAVQATPVPQQPSGSSFPQSEQPISSSTNNSPTPSGGAVTGKINMTPPNESLSPPSSIGPATSASTEMAAP